MRSVMWALVAAGLLGMCATGCSGGAGAVTSIANSSKKPAGGGGDAAAGCAALQLSRSKNEK